MNSRETLIYQALKFKRHHTGEANSFFLDAALASKDPEFTEHFAKITKNVCAMISIELADEMDQIGGILELNKREMITLAIIDFLEKARGVIEEFDVMPTDAAPEAEV